MRSALVLVATLGPLAPEVGYDNKSSGRDEHEQLLKYGRSHVQLSGLSGLRETPAGLRSRHSTKSSSSGKSRAQGQGNHHGSRRSSVTVATTPGENE